MGHATIDEIRRKARDGEFTRMSGNADYEDLVPIHFELFPEEVLFAAAKDLGMEDYIKNIYLYGISSQQTGASVKPQQLQGLVLTHGKLKKWLAANGAMTDTDLSSKAVLRAYLKFHNDRIKESTEAISVITDELTR